jgi:hypothetical protein
MSSSLSSSITYLARFTMTTTMPTGPQPPHITITMSPLQVARALANLAANPDMQPVIIAEGALPPMAALSLHHTMTISTATITIIIVIIILIIIITHCAPSQVARALANLAANPDMQPVIIAEGALPPMVASAQVRDVNCQRFASLCLANLATTIASQIKVRLVGRGGGGGGSWWWWW